MSVKPCTLPPRLNPKENKLNEKIFQPHCIVAVGFVKHRNSSTIVLLQYCSTLAIKSVPLNYVENTVL